MEDNLHKSRRKARYVAEVRFPLAPKFYDIRGHIIETLRRPVSDGFGTFQTDANRITFGDDGLKPVNQFTITSSAISFILEDASTLQEYVDKAVKHLGMAYDLLGPYIPVISRCGVRFFSIHAAPGWTSFEQVSAAVRRKFHLLPDVDLNYEDSLSRLIHKNGSFSIAPMRATEDWVPSVFLRAPEKVPDFGLYLDVDSFASSVAVRRKEDLIKCFRSVLGLTVAIERSLATMAGAIDG